MGGNMEKPDFLERFLSKLRIGNIRFVKRMIVGVVGATVLIIGVLLLVLPGPAFVVIPLGLAILATEFVWAKRWLQKAKGLLVKSKQPQKS